MMIVARLGLLVTGVVLTWTCALFGLLGCHLVGRLSDRWFLDPPFVRSAWPDRSYHHVTRMKKREPVRIDADRPRPRRAIRLLDDAVAKYALDRGRCPARKVDLIAGGYISAADAARRPDDSVAFVCTVDDQGKLSATAIPLRMTDDDRGFTCGNYAQ